MLFRFCCKRFKLPSLNLFTFGLAIFGFTGLCSSSLADTTRTQTIQLTEGWNAIFLEVQPSDSAPGAVFANVPVDVVASFKRSPLTTQYISDPSADLLQGAGWNVWYSDSRPDSFLSDLYAINAPSPLLVHSRADAELQVTGGAVPLSTTWQPDGFSFVGFGLIAGQEPTFAQFFAGASAHDRIYRLVDGHWIQILDLANTVMRSGEAFWAYSEGPSKFQGPFSVPFPSSDGVLLVGNQENLIFHNQSNHPITANVDFVPNGPLPAPVAVRVQVHGDPEQPVQWVANPMGTDAWQIEMPALEAGKSRALPLQAAPESMTGPLHSSLLHVTTDLGTETWIPLITVREDLTPSL